MTKPAIVQGFRCEGGSNRIWLFGFESAGKTQLVASLIGRRLGVFNMKGSTTESSSYRYGQRVLTDQPGLMRGERHQLKYGEMSRSDQVIVLVSGLHLRRDLHDLLPRLVGSRGILVVSFRDRMARDSVQQTLLGELKDCLGPALVVLDCRKISEQDRLDLELALDHCCEFQDILWPYWDVFDSSSPGGVLRKRLAEPLLAIILLLLPLLGTIFMANSFAEWLDPLVKNFLQPIVLWTEGSSLLWRILLAGNFGLVVMLPFLFVYALPTILLFAFLLAFYKSSGIIDRLAEILFPVLAWVRLDSRDLVRVFMGMGCKVPAIISSRSCRTCQRSACVHAISFGAMCSYQLPASLALLAAAQRSYLIMPLLVFVVVSTGIYLRLTFSTNRVEKDLSLPLQKPNWAALYLDGAQTIKQFWVTAIPIFVGICLLASCADFSGFLPRLETWLEPIMWGFNLPPEAARSLVMGSIRKDGLAVGLLGQSGSMPLIRDLSDSQLLTVIYLAGFLMPCLVTVLTSVRELGTAFTARLLMTQMLACSFFSLILAYGYPLIS